MNFHLLQQQKKKRIHEVFKKMFVEHPEIQELFKETPPSNLSKIEQPIQLNKENTAVQETGAYPKVGNTKKMIDIFEKITGEKNRGANETRTEKIAPKDEFIH